MDPPFSNSDSSRQKRRKIDPGAPIQSHRAGWRTAAAQQIYSSELVDALRHVRRDPPPSGGGRLVREAADRILASAARRRTRWSRAILTRQVNRRLRKHKKAKVTAGGLRPSRNRRGSRPLPAVESKVKFLGRLVPGCRKLPLPNLLEEASDYIAALEMQVRAMTALTELLAGMGSAGREG